MIEQFVERLNDRILAGLPGILAHRQMAPASRPLLDFREQDYPQAKKGSVLILFYPWQNEIYTVLIKRPDYEGVHSGQVSFPGGKIEANETAEAAALREANEEIGVDVSAVKIFNRLSNVYIPPSNFFVFPFLGYSTQRPHFIPEKNEVDYVIEMPVEIILDQKIKGSMEVIRGEETFHAPYYAIHEHKVWGATAILLSELEFLMTEIQF